MTDPSGTSSSARPEISGPVERPFPPKTWLSALEELVTARAGIIQLEMRQAAEAAIKRGINLAAAAVLLLFFWGLIVAGAIGAISSKAGYPWYWVALVAAGIHLLLALILVSLAKRPADRSFQITRAEFQKDREWLKNFQSPKKSND